MRTLNSTVGRKARATMPLTTMARARVLQRKCDCGQHTGGGECEECKKNKRSGDPLLQRSALNRGAAIGVPQIVHEVLRSPGQPLDGHDFSKVRVSGTSHVKELSQQVFQVGGGRPPAPVTPAPPPPPPAAAPAPAFPTATFARFVTAGPIRCCRIAGPTGCPAHLGPSVAGDPRNQNGVNVVFTIAGHRPAVEYGFVQTISSVSCDRASAAAGGAWTEVDRDAPGTDDSPEPGATCTRPDAANEITMTDGPGFQTALGGATRPGVDEMSMRLNATDWVIARELPGRWRRISDLFAWHSINRIRRNAAGNWELFPGGSAVGPGHTRLGGCPPP